MNFLPVGLLEIVCKVGKKWIWAHKIIASQKIYLFKPYDNEQPDNNALIAGTPTKRRPKTGGGSSSELRKSANNAAAKAKEAKEKAAQQWQRRKNYDPLKSMTKCMDLILIRFKTNLHFLHHISNQSQSSIHWS